MLKKDKAEVTDEVWTSERVKSFLDLIPPEDTNADFHALYTAYKSMRLDNFEEFLGYFTDAGRNFNAVNAAGETVAVIISQHKQGTPYGEALSKVS